MKLSNKLRSFLLTSDHGVLLDALGPLLFLEGIVLVSPNRHILFYLLL